MTVKKQPTIMLRQRYNYNYPLAVSLLYNLGWWFGTFEGKEGWVPSTYLKPCSDHNDTNDDKQNEIGTNRL